MSGPVQESKHVHMNNFNIKRILNTFNEQHMLILCVYYDVLCQQVLKNSYSINIQFQFVFCCLFSVIAGGLLGAGRMFFFSTAISLNQTSYMYLNNKKIVYFPFFSSLKEREKGAAPHHLTGNNQWHFDCSSAPLHSKLNDFFMCSLLIAS